MKLENFKKIIAQNSINENQLADVETILTPLTYETYPKTLLYYISNVQPMVKPTALVNSVESYLHGDTDEIYNNTSILKINKLDEKGYTVGDLVEGTKGGAGTILYIDNKTILIKLLSRNSIFVPQESIDGSRITNVYSSKAFARAILSKYTETNNINQISLKFNQNKLEAKTRKIKSKTTMEVIQDLQRLHKENYNDILADMMSSQVRSEMDRELIAYLKSIARFKDNLILSDSISGDIPNILVEITYRIAECVTDICNRTHKPQRGFAIVSPNIANALIPQLVDYNNDDTEVYLGRLGTTRIFQDLGADEDTVIVGFKSDFDDDAGMIFAPYNQTIVKHTDHQGDPILYLYNRYAYTLNPQDLTPDNNNSDFFMQFNVDFDNIPNLGMGSGAPQDIRSAEINWNNDGTAGGVNADQGIGTNFYEFPHQDVSDVEVYVAGFLLTLGKDYVLEDNKVIFFEPPEPFENITFFYTYILVDTEYHSKQENFESDGVNLDYILAYEDIIDVQVFVGGRFMREGADQDYVLNGNKITLTSVSYDGALIKITYKFFRELTRRKENKERIVQIETSDGSNTFTINDTDVEFLKVYISSILLTEIKDYSYDRNTRVIEVFNGINPGETISLHYLINL